MDKVRALKNTLRWIVCLPVGSFFGFLVFIIFNLIGNRYLEPGSIGSYMHFLLSGGISGAVFVYVTVYVVPSHRKWVGAFVAVVSVLLLFLSIPILSENKDWGLLSFYIAQDVGSIYVAYEMFKSKITFKG